MGKCAEIEFRVIGKNGQEDISPDNYDISNIRTMIDDVEDLLYPNNKKARPVISYEMKEGSVRNIFKTSRQNVVQLIATLTLVSSSGGSLEALEPNTAKAIERMQQMALQKNYSIEISTSEDNMKKPILRITPQTKFTRNDSLWVDAELYYYGLLTDAGGKDKANIHLDTKDDGLLLIRVAKDYLSQIEGNPLYRSFGVHVRGKQNLMTGDVDKSSLELLSLVDYSPKYDESYINGLIENAAPKFSGIDADEWLNSIRGGNENE
jgi:hypothetical protein